MFGVVQASLSFFPSLFVCVQRVLSRQEELKERARLLLEQARRDAAMKAGSRSATATNTSSKAANACDVSTVYVCGPGVDQLIKRVSAFFSNLRYSSAHHCNAVARRGNSIASEEELFLINFRSEFLLGY